MNIMKHQPYGYILACACASLLLAQCSGGQGAGSPRVNDRYMRKVQYTPAQDAEKARESRKLVDGLQALARSCTDVRLVFSDLTSSAPADRQYTVLQSLGCLLKMQPLWATHLAKFKSATFSRKPPVSLLSKNLDDIVVELVAWLAPPMLESHRGKWSRLRAPHVFQ